MPKSTFALLAAFAALLAGAGCATAQSDTREIAPGVTMTGNSIISHRGTRLGFIYAATPVLGADGQVRSADYPVVTEVTPGSEAQQAGLRAGDVILRVNGRDGHEAALFRKRDPGTHYHVTVRRGTEEVEMDFTFAEHPRQ
jgi:S1-C subfamily serine protease